MSDKNKDKSNKAAVNGAENSDNTMIEVKNISKVYRLYDKPSDRIKESLSLTKKKYSREHKALDGIDIKIKKGESVGLVGRNGSGKSTLLKLITGVVTPTGGEIVTHGRIAALLELGAGFNMEYTGIENIYLNGTMMGYSEKEMEERIPSIIEFADIGDFIYQPVKSYSSGMFARLAFAVSINVDPDILIVDEALAVGDMRFQVKCIDKMKELKEAGTTILFVTHAVEQIKRFCTRTIWLKDGQIVKDGEAGVITDLYANYMIYGDQVLDDNEVDEAFDEEFIVPENSEYLASIKHVALNKQIFKSFESLEFEVIYDIYAEELPDFSFGVAIYSRDRKQYIFGPNTLLDKADIPKKQGRHKIIYRIPKITLISGDYALDVGIFNSDGIVNLDYKNSCAHFSVANEYFTEGMFYLDHEWDVVE